MGKCPACGHLGQPVSNITVRSIVVDPCAVHEDDYHLCLNPNCDTVYYGGKDRYTKKEVKVKIWFKESSPVTICYCAGVTDQEIIDHIVKFKCCNNMADIKKHTGANSDNRCQTMNPSGK